MERRNITISKNYNNLITLGILEKKPRIDESRFKPYSSVVGSYPSVIINTMVRRTSSFGLCNNSKQEIKNYVQKTISTDVGLRIIKGGP